MKAKHLVSMLLAGSMILGLTACAPTTNSGGGNDSPQPTGTDSGSGGASSEYLVYNVGEEPKIWDPQLNTSSMGGHVILNLYDGLVRDTRDGVQMASAERYELSANADGVEDTVYTFYLRDGLTWSDGEPVTAHDYEYAWKRACSPEMASPYAFLMTDYIKGAYEYFSGEGSRDEVAVKALDDKTLQVELKQPTAYFLNLVSWFTYMPCREDMASTGEGWEKDPAKCVSNGAFMLEEYKVGSHILLKKNPNFWNADNVNLAGVRILFISDATTSLQGYEAGEINVTSILPGAEIPRLLAEDPNFSSEPALGNSYFQFNMDADVVNDLNVRKALSLAIDRSTITDQILRDGSVPASAFVAPPFKLSTGESMRALDENGNVVEEYEIDPYSAKVEDAQAYLAEAGYPGGAGFPELNVLYYDSGNNSLIVEAVQQMWQENLGIKVNLQVQEYAVFTNTINSGDWSIAFTGWSADGRNITDDCTITANYEQNSYTVRFVDYDGTELSSQSVFWGEAAAAPEAPAREGYTFTGWDADFSNIRKDLTVTAQYRFVLSFADVSETDWFCEDVRWAVENGIFQGVGNGLFAPEQALTRGQLVTVLYRMVGSPEPKAEANFRDVAADSYYAKAVAWANENGIVLGMGDGTFDPDSAVTREQMVTIFFRYAKFCGVKTEAGMLDAFRDAASVSDYAREAMGWAVKAGLVKGDGQDLMPKATASRAQAAAILHRFAAVVEK